MGKFIYLKSPVRHNDASINYSKPMVFWRIWVEEVITISKVKAVWGDSHSISAFHVGCPYCLKGHCAGLGWNRAKSLYSSWHRAVFGFVLKTGWQHRHVFVIAEQSQGLFCFSYCSASEGEQGNKELGGNTHLGSAVPADLNDQSNIPHGMMMCSARKLGGKVGGSWGALHGAWLGMCQLVVRKGFHGITCISLVLFLSVFVIFSLFLTIIVIDCKLLNCFYLGPQIFSPHSTEGEVSCCVVLSHQLSLSHVQNHVRKLSLCHLNCPRKMMEMHRSH